MESNGNGSGGCWRPGVAGCRRKMKTRAEQSGTRQVEEATAGCPTSMDARKTIILRDAGESLTSETHQGTAQGKAPRGHQNPFRGALYECMRRCRRTDAYREGYVSRRDGHGNRRGSGRIFRQDLYSSLDVWHGGSVEAKCASTCPPRKMPQVPLQRYSIQA